MESTEKFPISSLLSLKSNFSNNYSFVAFRKRLFKNSVPNSTKIYFPISTDIIIIQFFQLFLFLPAPVIPIPKKKKSRERKRYRYRKYFKEQNITNVKYKTEKLYID